MNRKKGGGIRRPMSSSNNNRRALLRPPSPNTASEAWLNAIQDATECVTPNSNDQDDDDDIVASLNYLNVLGSILEEQSFDWDSVPLFSPPEFTTENVVDLAYYASGNHHYQHNAQTTVPSSSLSTWNANAVSTSSSSNRYATFQNDDDDESSSDDDDDTNNDDEDDEPPQSESTHVHVSMRRLMIRVVTAQSEVYACQAGHAPPQWQHGADLYQFSLDKIHYALDLCDSECAKWLEQGDVLPQTLKQDANIVEVAIQYLTLQTTKFIKRAQHKQEQLVRRLEPQWTRRNAIREKMGEERWTNNPHPKRNYATLRQDDEEQLRQVRAALACMEEMDTQGAVESSQNLIQQVSTKKKKRNKRQPKRRNNGKRPTDLSKRVPLSEYPDPTDYGWTFTGSSDNLVEFFENDSVKLDWYFTTATVKTSLGKKQLFGASHVTANMYLEILLNPHTIKERTKRNQKKTSDRYLWIPQDG